MKKLSLVISFLLLSVGLKAQSQFLQWEMPLTTDVQANSYVYKWSIDSKPEEIVNTKCLGSNPSICKTPLPALIPTVTHSIVLFATDVSGAEGGRSSPFQVSIPAVPNNIKAVK